MKRDLCKPMYMWLTTLKTSRLRIVRALFLSRGRGESDYNNDDLYGHEQDPPPGGRKGNHRLADVMIASINNRLQR